MIEIWGHRGCRGTHNPPENSLAAFAEAIRQGVNGVELDVLLSADDQLVVFHDDTLERMTDGHGPVANYTLAELKALRLKGPDGQLTDERIPTLDEVLDVVKQEQGDHKVNTEIKHLHGRNSADKVAQVLKKRMAEGWDIGLFQVSSFDMDCLREMRRSLQQVAIGALFAGEQEPWDISEDELSKRLDEIGDIHPQTINLTLPSMTPGAVAMIKAMNAEPIAWTSGEKNPDEMHHAERHALAMTLQNGGLATIITDYPGQIRRVLNIYRATDAVVAAGR